MLLKTAVIALLAGSSIASAIPNRSTNASNATISETGRAPTHFEIPHGCHKIDGHVACPKEHSINARARAPAPSKPKPATSSKPKPATSEKPKPATTSKPKPTTSEKPKPTTSSKPKPTTLKKIQSTTSGKPKSTASSEPTSSTPTSSKSTSSTPTSSKSISGTPTSGTSQPTGTANANCKRDHLGGQPSCELPIVAPINQDSIPGSITCVGRGSFDSATNIYSRDQIFNATRRGIQYAVTNKKATKNKYPHRFFNDENLPVDPNCAGKIIQEFPILPDKVLDVSGSDRDTDVGLDRVLFTHPNKVNGNQEDYHNSEVFYCGIITHNGPRTEKGQPFHTCT